MFRISVVTIIFGVSALAQPAIGPTPEDLRQFYSLHQGGDLLPVSWLRTLPGTRSAYFLDMKNLDQYGLIANPFCKDYACATPAIGLSSDGKGMMGVTCAACHVSELHWNSITTNILHGAPNMFDSEAFIEGVLSASEQLLKPSGFARVVRNAIDSGTASVPASAKTGLILFLDSLADLSDKSEETVNVSLDLMERLLPQRVAAIRHELFNVTLQELAAQPTLPFEPKGISKSDFASNTWQLTSPDDLVKFAVYVRERVRYLAILQQIKANQRTMNFGPGRVDDFGGARDIIWPGSAVKLNGPSSILDLWNFQQAKRVHWDYNMDSVMDRNIGQAVAGGALYKPPLVTLDIRNIHTLETIANKFSAPAWPAGWPFDDAKGKAGAVIFSQKILDAQQHTCGGCHNNNAVIPIDAIGTDPNRALTYDQPMHDGDTFSDEAKPTLLLIKNWAFEKAGIFDENTRREMDPMRDKADWHPMHGYVARGLKGVWATSPYLHNGSVLTLWEVLSPKDRRSKFRLGHRDYDPIRVGFEYRSCAADSDKDGRCVDTRISGNGNMGHVYGATLTDDERQDVIEYLKTR